MKFISDKVAVGLPDAHLDPFDRMLHPAYSVARQYVFDIRPDILVFMGDMGTFDSLSNWNKNKPLFAEGRRYKDDVAVVKDELYTFKYKLPDTEMIYIMGNHENRARWYIEKNPEMQDFIDIENDLGLADLGMKVVPFKDAIQIGQLWWTHGWFWNKYHAAKTLTDFGDNVVYGHVHHFQQDTRNVHFKKKEQIAQSVGCLTSRYPDWKGGSPTRFQNGFVTVEYTADDNFSMYPHIIIKGAFSYGGFTWSAY